MKCTNLSHCDFHNTLLVLKWICIVDVLKYKATFVQLQNTSQCIQDKTLHTKSISKFLLLHRRQPRHSNPQTLSSWIWHPGNELPNHNCFFLLNKTTLVHWILIPLIFFLVLCFICQSLPTCFILLPHALYHWWACMNSVSIVICQNSNRIHQLYYWLLNT